MSMFEQAMEEFCGVVDQAAQKTGEALESSKGQVERIRLRNTLNDMFRQLGQAQFITAMGEADRSEEIQTLLSEIKKLRDRYVALCKSLHPNGGVTCEKCGRYHRNGGAYCSDCGAAMPKHQ